MNLTRSLRIAFAVLLVVHLASAFASVALLGRMRPAIGRIIEQNVRSLEAASADGRIAPFDGETDLFINPGFEFQTVDAMITNFHLPQSSLLMLVAAFSGFDPIMQAYRHAVAERYRFYSYGDAMLLLPARR